MRPEPTNFSQRDIRFFFPKLSPSATALNEAAIDARIRPVVAGVEDDSDTEEHTNKKLRVG